MVGVSCSILSTLAKYQTEFSWHGGLKVISKPQSIISSTYLHKNPHELRWILIMTEAQTANTVWGQKKRCLWGTSNSHNPQLTWTSAQSKASVKVRGDASTYMNYERSQHREKTPMPISVTRTLCVSISHKGIFFPSFHVLGFCISWSVLSSCLVECSLVNLDLQASVHRYFQLFIMSQCLLNT